MKTRSLIIALDTKKGRWYMQYDPRQRHYTGSLDDAIMGYMGYEEEQAARPQRTHRPARRLGNAEQAVIAERLARQRAIDEARARQRNVRGNTRRPTDAYPQVRKQPERQEDALEEDELYDDEELSTRAPRSAIKYQPIEPYVSGATFKPGSPPPSPNQKHVIPPRRSASAQNSRTQQQQKAAYDEEEEDVEEMETQRPPRRRRNVSAHPSLIVGIALVLLLIVLYGGYLGLNAIGTAWQNHTDDVTYGMPRTYQTDAVVGHGDSNSSPSHFIAINLRGSIYVIEAPGGDISKARQYFITTEVNQNPYPPVTVKFEYLTHSGHLDMVVSVGDPPTPLIVFLFNNGTQFVGKS